MPPEAIARVLLDSPLPQLDRLFDYRVPERLRDAAAPGVRVLVPLRSAGRQSKGYLIELIDEAGHDLPLSEIDEVVSAAPVLTSEVWKLIRRAADRAGGVASDLVRLAVPVRQVRVEKSWLARPAHPTVPEPPATNPRPPDPPGYAADAFVGLVPSPADEDGAVYRRAALAVVPAPIEVRSGIWVRAALATLATLAAQTLYSGRSAIVAVPDHRDLEQVVQCLENLVEAADIARIDARQPAADRYRSFLRTLEDRPVLVVGNRTALLAPAHRLGLIAVWDDGDAVHVEPHAPGVHTRDLALLRQEMTGCGLVFAAHARSTDIQRLIEIGWLDSIEPAGRWRRAITSTAVHVGEQDVRARIPSGAWKTVATALTVGPVLVQVARPGYAPRFGCADCGLMARCLDCGGPIATTRAGSTPSCRWCGHLAAERTCPACGGHRWRALGRGSIRTADELGRAFPGARVVVSDGQTPLVRAPGGRTLVVATRGAEPVVDGGYRAVLLLDGEQMLARESLRVVEDCTRWWCNAAALAARDAPVILVGIGGRVANALATGRPERIAADELRDRRVLRFPPAVRVAVVSGTPAAVQRAVEVVGDMEGVDTLGPVELTSDTVRAILRFDYGVGPEVAARLKAEVVRSATRRAPRPSPGAPRRREPALRVRLDDSEPFDELASRGPSLTQPLRSD